MIVSVTEVESFKRCRRQWDLGSFNRQALTPIIQPKPYLDLGTMVHKSLAYWTQKPVDDSGAITDLRKVFLVIANQHQNNAIQKYKNATGNTPTDEEIDPLMDAITLGSFMMENYQTYYTHPLPDNLRFCSPEQEIVIPIPNTEHMCETCVGMGSFPGNNEECPDCNGSGVGRHYLKARLDALAQDEHDNIYVIERKTYENRPNLALLQVTDQFVGYVWAAQQLDVGYVVGLAYDGLWKRAQPPQRPKRLELSDLFCRTLIPFSQTMIDEYGIELAQTVTEMANKPAIYKNRVWQGCWDCSFEQLCRAMSEGDDVESILTRQYMRRTEDDTVDIVQLVDSRTQKVIA